MKKNISLLQKNPKMRHYCTHCDLVWQGKLDVEDKTVIISPRTDIKQSDCGTTLPSVRSMVVNINIEA
jgi:hypothetical protein